MKDAVVLAVVAVLLLPSLALSEEDYGPYKVDTGSHTCDRQGKDVFKEEVFKAPPDRYFVKEKVSFEPVSIFGEGKCQNFGVVGTKDLNVKLPNGQTVQMSVPTAYRVIAVADCTSNLSKVGSRIGTECRFSAKTQEFD